MTLSLPKKQVALEAIAQEIEACSICRQNIVGLPVPGEGSAEAKVVFVGEAPGKQEAVMGRPFVGRAGKILRALIADTGLKEQEVFITSVLKYLPVHVTPKSHEVAHGRTHLFAQLDVIQPRIIVLLGRVACLAVLERNVLIAKDHGTVIEQDGRTYLIAYHPAAALYSQAAKAPLKEDFGILKEMV